MDVEVTRSVKGKKVKYKKTIEKNIWDCSIYNRAEKELKTIVRTKQKQKYKAEVITSEFEKKNAEFIKMRKDKRSKKEQDVLVKHKNGRNR